MFWGFSEALDLYSEYQQSNHLEDNAKKSLNILLFGSADPRHILKTLAKSYNHNVQLNIYILDGCIEIVARNLLLLAVAFEKSTCLSLKAKTHLYMDIYGNSLLRPATNQYIISKSNALTEIISDSDTIEEKMKIFNVEHLKYRERDGLENTFHFWLAREEHVFNMHDYWEQRNRAKLGVRYDYRHGAFDWDLQMRLKDCGAKQICSQEYKHWRDTGIAFTFPEYEQSKPNKTLSAGLIRNGRHYRHRGYVGDTEVGPFCAFGLKTDDERLTKSSHGDNDYRATDVTERNLFEIFYEIEERKAFDCTSTNGHKYGCTILDLGTTLPTTNVEDIEIRKFDEPLQEFPNAKIYFLSMDDTLTMQSGNKFQKFFDIVFVANNYFEFLKNPFCNIFADNALILFETKTYSVLNKEDICAFLQRIKNFTKDGNLKTVTNFNINLNYSIVKYRNCDC